MTSFRKWIKDVEFDASRESSEPKKLYDAISTQQGNEKFSVQTIIEDGKNIDVITKNGFGPNLKIKSPQARNKFLSVIQDDYLPLKKLR